MTGKLDDLRPTGRDDAGGLRRCPLYYYAKDTKAGDTTGQGVGGKWFVASPTGRPRSQSGSSAAPSSSGKYGSPTDRAAAIRPVAQPAGVSQTW